MFVLFLCVGTAETQGSPQCDGAVSGWVFYGTCSVQSVLTAVKVNFFPSSKVYEGLGVKTHQELGLKCELYH